MGGSARERPAGAGRPPGLVGASRSARPMLPRPPPLAREPGDRWERVTILLAPGLSRYVVEKGSIAVDGVSLTVAELGADTFTVGLIPTTLKLTTLGDKGVGDPVNLEVDMIAKYVE